MRKKIEVVQARILKLDPSKPYLVSLPDGDFSQEETHLLSAKLKEWGLEKVIVVNGEVKVSEIKSPEQKNASH